jgi:hypothetical protein
MIFPATNPALADAIMETIAKTAEAAGLRYYVICGTLLGWWRDNGYIPWDNDLDVGIFFEPDKYDDFMDRMLRLGFTTDIGSPWEAKHFWKYDMLTDVMFLHPAPESAEFYDHPGHFKRGEYSYIVPSPVPEYLLWKYGPTWHTPLRDGEYPKKHEE